jgi:flagellar hook-associated protein 2
VLAEPGAAVVSRAADASVTLWGGTAAAQTVTSGTNTFADLLPGVSVTVSKPSTDPTTVTVGRDSTKAQAVASGLVDALNAVTSYYASNTGVTSTTSPTSGTTSTTAGVLLGDATTRSAVQRLTSAMSTPVNGKSPSSIGIVISKDGDFDFDAAAFQKALSADPVGTQAILSGVAKAVSDAATAASDKYTGSITTAITGKQSVVKDLTTQIDSWTDRLTMRRATLQTQYAALETSLSKLQSQSSWLAGQLSALSN